MVFIINFFFFYISSLLAPSFVLVRENVLLLSSLSKLFRRCFCMNWFRLSYPKRQTPAYLQHPSGGDESVLRKLWYYTNFDLLSISCFSLLFYFKIFVIYIFVHQIVISCIKKLYHFLFYDLNLIKYESVYFY